MRISIMLPFCALLATPAFAQPAAPVTLSVPHTTPIDGWGADKGNFSSRPIPRDLAKVQNLIAQGRYPEADPLLNKLMGQTSIPRVRFLKGVTALGLGDAATARRYFERALPTTGYGDPGTLSGLAIAQARLGNIKAAQHILVNLRDQQSKCGTSCDRAEHLDRAVSIVERLLA